MFVFRLTWIIFGALMISLNYYLSQVKVGLLWEFPKLIIGFIGCFCFIRGLWLSDRASIKYQEKRAGTYKRKYKKSRSGNYRNCHIMIIGIVIVIASMIAVNPVIAADVDSNFTLELTSDFDNGTKVQVETYTDNIEVVNDTFRLGIEDLANNFDSEEEGQSPPDGFTNIDLGNYEVDNVHSSSGDQSCWMQATSAGWKSGYLSQSYDSNEKISMNQYLNGADVYYRLDFTSTDDVPTAENLITQFYLDNANKIKMHDGEVLTDTGYNYVVGEFKLVELQFDFGTDTYDAWYGGELIADDYSFYLAAVSLERLTFVCHGTGTSEMWIDDIQFGENPYYTEGNWTTQNITAPTGTDSYYTNITYINASENTYLRQVDWIIDYSVVATYENNEISGTYVNITEADLESGSFASLTQNYSIRVYLFGDGNETVNITSISGQGEAIEVEPYENPGEGDNYPDAQGSSGYNKNLKWYEAAWLEFQLNTNENPWMIVLIGAALIGISLMVLGGGKR